MMNTRSRSESKRDRPTTFNEESERYNRETKKKKMNSLNSNVASKDGQIRDLSSTINRQPAQGDVASPAFVAQTATDSGGERYSTPGNGRSHTADRALEDRMKNLISNEVNDIRKTLDTLVRTVQGMALGGNNAANGTGSQGSRSMSTNASQPGSSGSSSQRDRPPSTSTNYSQPPLNDDRLRIRVDKFGINFDGNTMRLTVEEFIFRLECLQSQYGVPWEEILRDFRLLVSGPVLEWFWQSQKLRNFTQWIQLKDALLCQYRSTKSAFEAMRDLVDRKQLSNEPVDAYFQAMGQLRSRLLHPITDQDMISIIKVNVKENIKMVVYPMSIATVEMLRVECKEAERNFPRRDPRPVAPHTRPTRHVNEVALDEYEFDEHETHREAPECISAIRTNIQQNRTIVCWNCRAEGHMFMDCPSSERGLFCYRCGRPNTITPRCQNCQSGNSKRGVANPGETRPSENPAK